MTTKNGTKISSPAPHLVKEVKELEEAKDLIVKLQTELVNEKTGKKKLEKQIELGLSESQRAEIHLSLERDGLVASLQDRLDTTRHQLKVSMDEANSLRERARLLQEDNRNVKDKYELDVEWKRLMGEIRMKEEVLENLRKQIQMQKVILDEEVKDLDSIRGRYNNELDRLQQAWQHKRAVIDEYNLLRKKFKEIPPLPATLMGGSDVGLEAPVEKKRSLLKRMFKRRG